MTTLKDIAEIVNISTSTISRLLNNDPTLCVSESKRKEILDAVNKLGYESPKRSKKKFTNHLESTRSDKYQEHDIVMINFLTPTQEIDDPYFTSIRAGIQKRCLEIGSNVTSLHLGQVSKNWGVIKKAPAVIAVGHYPNDIAHQLYQSNQNLSFVDSNPLGCSADAVIIDRVALSNEVMNNILTVGCKRPAFIGNNEERLHIFRKVTIENNIYFSELCKVSKEYCIESGYQAMKEILKTSPHPDVVYAATDMVAIGVYRAIYEFNLSIPDDIQVIGTNDIPSARHMNPSLTTVQLYPFEMGEIAVDLAIEKINGRAYSKTVLIGHKLIYRDSFSK